MSGDACIGAQTNESHARKIAAPSGCADSSCRDTFTNFVARWPSISIYRGTPHAHSLRVGIFFCAAPSGATSEQHSWRCFGQVSRTRFSPSTKIPCHDRTPSVFSPLVHVFFVVECSACGRRRSVGRGLQFGGPRVFALQSWADVLPGGVRDGHHV